MSMLFDRVLPEVLRIRAEETPDRTFFQMIDGLPVSYAEAYARACALANGLVDIGVKRGDYVVIMAENSEESISSWLGVHLAGAVEVAINTAYLGRPLVHALQNSRARVLFIAEDLLAALAEVRDSLTHLEIVIVYSDERASPTNRPAFSGLRVHEFKSIHGDRKTAPDRPVGPQDLGAIVYTSGTTGPAKGVMMPHGQISLFARLGIEGAHQE